MLIEIVSSESVKLSSCPSTCSKLNARPTPKPSVAVDCSRSFPTKEWVCTVVLDGRLLVTRLVHSLYAFLPSDYKSPMLMMDSSSVAPPSRKNTSSPSKTTTPHPGAKTSSPPSSAPAHPSSSPLPWTSSKLVSKTETSRTRRAVPESSRI